MPPLHENIKERSWLAQIDSFEGNHRTNRWSNLVDDGNGTAGNQAGCRLFETKPGRYKRLVAIRAASAHLDTPGSVDPFSDQLRRASIETGWRPVPSIYLFKYMESPDGYPERQARKRIGALSLQDASPQRQLNFGEWPL
jgi:hypothetical protein